MKKPGTISVFFIAFLLLSFQLPTIFFSENIEGLRGEAKKQGLPPVQVEATVSGSLPQVDAGYCQLGQSTVTFTNLGQAGDPFQSIINDLALGIGLGQASSLTDGAFEIIGIRIAGVDLDVFNALNPLDGNALFSTDPDGNGGLSDSDNDGFFDDLELGESVEITALYRLSCGLTNSTSSNCQNNLETSLSATMNYLEQGSPQSIELESYLEPSSRVVDFENFSSPDAFLGVDTFIISHRQIRTFNDFVSSCNDEGLFRAHLKLPAGVIPILGETNLAKNGTEIAPTSSVISNDTLFLEFPSPGGDLSGEYILTNALMTDCFASISNSGFDFSLSHFCPSCACEHKWFCGDLPSPQFHATSPPCPIEVVPPCDKGVKSVSFEVERATFGFADLDFTIPFDPQGANKKVALGCDSVHMKLVSVVGTNPISDSIGVVVNYANPDGSASPEETFLFDSGVVRFTHSGMEMSCPISAQDLVVVNDAGAKTLTFNLNDCLTDLGFSLVMGDTIDFTGLFSVNPDGPFGSDFRTVPDFRAFAFATNSGQQFSCDNFGETFTVAKTEASYEFPTTSAGMPMGCEEGELHFRVVVPDNDFADYFGQELRAANKINSFLLSFDPILFQAYDDLEIAASIPGHPDFGNDYFPLQPLDDFPSGIYQANFDTLIYVPALNILSGHSLDVRLRLSPNCQAEANNNIELTSQVIFRDRYYGQTIGDGSCVKNRLENGNNQLEYSSPPQLEITSITPVTDTTAGDFGQWTVRVCNTSPTANAPVAWFAVDDPEDNLESIELTDVTDPGSPLLLLPIPYPDGFFGFGPPLTAGSCLDIQIRANASVCGNFDFNALTGWNCGSYGANWNPSLNAPCSEVGTGLELVNQLSAPIDMEFLQVFSTCDGGGEELIFAEGQLTVESIFPTDDFTLTFVFDENDNGQIESTEPILAEQIITGAIAPDNPLVFEQTFSSTPEEACRILATVDAASSDLCEEVLVALPVPQILNAGEDQVFCELDGTNLLTTLGNPNCGASGYSFTWSALFPGGASALSDTLSALPTLDLMWEDYLGQSIGFVLETERTGCTVSTFDTVQIQLPVVPYGFFDGDSVVLQAVDCQSLVEFCMGVDSSQASTLQVTDNGLPYPSAAFTSCDDTLLAVQLGTGFHELVATDLATGCSDSIFVTVKCSVIDTLNIDIVLNETDTVCFSNDEIIGAIQTLENYCEDGSFVSYEPFQDSCLILTGDWVGAEQACIVVCDNIGFCDTTILEIEVLHPLPNGIKDSIVIEQLGEYCFDENLLNIAGPIETIQNICPNLSGTSNNFSIEEDLNCIYYFGIDLGVDTACVELCDALGNCDTVSVCVSVVPGQVIFDTVFIEVDTNVFCLSDSLLPGEIIAIEDICTENNGDEVQFVIEDNCIIYYGDVVGVDTACIRFEDEFGNVGLTQFIVTVVRTIPESICDSVFVGEVRMVCLDTSELPGNFVYIEEICPDVRTGLVDIFIDPVTLCVDYEGIAVGFDTACVVVCDDFGFCDTTFFCLEVAPYFDLPVIYEDTSSTQKGTPVVIDFLANDTLFGGITDIFILDPPISGSAVLNLQNSFTYTPDDPFCARWDNFTYVACNPNGCDTTTVSIFIECIELTVFSAVSPNNDGVNDYFFIAKIEDFPDNHIWVYNRWGNLVFEKNEYENNWPGSWGEDIELPDGTYYYILEWSDGGTTTVQRGYFEMFR